MLGDAAIDWLVDMAVTVPGWRVGAEAKALAQVAYDMPGDPTIVEVGVFMGRSTILLAGARRLHGGGHVHCVDAFDCSGDDFSVPHYVNELAQIGARSLEAVFRQNIDRFCLGGLVSVHNGASSEIAAGWCAPIDLLVLDADQSPAGAREAFDHWVPFVRQGGMVVVSNSGEREYAPTHDGNYIIAKEQLRVPLFGDVRCVMYATFARKSA